MPTDNNTSDFIDIKGLLKTYWAKWYYFAISVVIFGLIGCVIAVIKKPVYQVKANIVLSSNDNDMGALSAIAAMTDFGSFFGANADIEDEIFIVTSHTVLSRVAKDLNLNVGHDVYRHLIIKDFKYKDYPIQVYAAPGLMDTLKTGIIFKIKATKDGEVKVKAKAKRKTIVNETGTFPMTVETPYGRFTIDKTAFYPADKSVTTLISVAGYGSTAEDLAEDITIDMASKKSSVIQLGFKTSYPEYGEEILNKIIELYNQHGVDVKNKQNEKTANFLRERITLVEGQLNTAEAEMQAFKERNGLTNITADLEYAFKQKGAMEVQLYELQAQSEILKLTLEFLNDPDNRYSVLPITSEAGQGLGESLKSYNELILQRMSIVNNAKPNNAALRLLDEQIDALRESIKQSVDKSLTAMNVTINDLDRKISTTNQRLGTLPAQQRDFTNLYRQQAVKQELYLYLLKSQEETAMLLANPSYNAEIIDEAYTLNDPLGLSRKMLLAIFVLFGFCVPPVVIYLQNMTRNKFGNTDELSFHTNLPILGETTDNDDEPCVLARNPNSQCADEFRDVRANLLFLLKPGEKVIVVTSANAAGDATYVAINIASSLALIDKRVALLDLSLANPTLKAYDNGKHSKHVDDYLNGNANPGELASREALMPYLDLFSTLTTPTNPTEKLMSAKVDNLVEELKDQYDYIVIIGPSMDNASALFSLNRLADANVYVARAEATTVADLRRLNKAASSGRITNASIVLNGVGK